MSAEKFKQNGLGWQVDLLRQRIDEYIEFKVSQLSADIPRLEFLQSELFWQIVRVILWSITAILLVWISWRIWLLLRFYLRRWQRQKQTNNSTITMVTSKITVAEWVARSQEYGKQGDYRQGIFCLYQAMLHLLEDRAIIERQSSLTDREYRRSLQNLQLSQLQTYELLLSTHQRLCFSSAEASKSLFEQCLQAYRSIETQ
ncbi:MAG: DUF4129 domain-containing protein [Xenococcaceae cyanobacterium]